MVFCIWPLIWSFHVPKESQIDTEWHRWLLFFLNLFEVTFLLLMNYFRPTARILIEQPTSSWMYKQTRMLEAISRWKVKKYLTYMGSWGAPLMKGTHLMSNFSCSAIVRKATKSLRETVAKRLKTLNEKRLAKGLPATEFWVRDRRGKFHGGKDLSSTAIYPQRFATAILKEWERSL